MLEFGKPKREITDPGLHYKVPFIQNVEYFDKRILDIDTASQEVIASDQKRLVVDAFARYRITDPLLFFQSVRDERIANSRLGAILEASLRRVLGSASFADVVRDQREGWGLPQRCEARLARDGLDGSEEWNPGSRQCRPIELHAALAGAPGLLANHRGLPCQQSAPSLQNGRNDFGRVTKTYAQAIQAGG